MGFSITEKLDFIRLAFGNIKTSNGNTNVAITCPVCLDSTGRVKFKLAIRLSDDALHCWVCGYRARSLVPLLRYTKQQNLISQYVSKFRDNDQYTALEHANEYHIPSLNDINFQLITKCANNEFTASNAIAYLFKRGININDMWKRMLGISNHTKYKNRIIIPSFSNKGKLNYFTCRSFVNDQKRYINPEIPRENIIFNEININWAQELVITEGPFDMMKCGDNATCLLGSELSTDSQLFDMLATHSTNVILALDDDAQQKQQKIAQLLTSYGINVRVIDLHGFHDMGEASHHEAMEMLASAHKWSKFDPLLTKIKLIRSSTFF